MPYEWLPPSPDGDRLHLWPFRSLPPRGFVWFIGATAALIAVPLIGLIGTPVLWGLLPFLVAAVAAIWFALRRSYRDGEILEDLFLSENVMRLVRHGPGGLRQEWEANPHWVRVIRHETGAAVPNYLTLRGGPREVEIGAFLSEVERLELAQDLNLRLDALRDPDEPATP